MPVRSHSLDPARKERHLAALEALFAPKRPAAPAPAAAPSTRSLAKIVSVRAADPARERLLAALLAADGAEPVRRAVRALERAGHGVPRQQDALLRMLQHPDERRVRAAIDTLAALFDDHAPERRAVLEARLRRLEELADDVETRDAATALRRRLHRAQA
jgi:hypothetical protein